MDRGGGMTVPRIEPLVVMATDSAVPSGVGTHMITLARAVGASYRVTLAFPPTEAGRLFLNRAATDGFPAQPISTVEAFEHWLRQTAAALLHIHAGIGWEGHRLARAAHAVGMPVVRTEHLPYVVTNEEQKAEHRQGIGLIDRMVFVSHAAAETFRQAGFRADGRRLCATVSRCPSPPHRPVRPASSSTCRLMRRSSSRSRGLPRRRTMEPCSTRPSGSSGSLAVFASSWSAMVQRPAMQEQAAASGLGDAVMFLGHRDDVPDLLSAASLSCCPLVLRVAARASGGHVTGHSRSSRRASAGLRKRSAPTIPGWFSPGMRKRGCRHHRSLTDEQRRRQIGRSNRDRFETYFRADRMGREMVALYRSVVSQRACAA